MVSKSWSRGRDRCGKEEIIFYFLFSIFYFLFSIFYFLFSIIFYLLFAGSDSTIASNTK